MCNKKTAVRTRTIVIGLVTSLIASTSGSAQQPINLLIFKGTHNSYACCGGESFFAWDNSCPVMHNPPNEQMDDYGVWALELDFSVELEGSNPVLYVGHDGSRGEDTFTHPDWGSTLRDFLVRIRNTRSLQYRPVFIFFNKKDWGAPNYRSESAWAPLLEKLLVDVFDTDSTGIFGSSAFASKGNKWPSVPELKGKVIPYTGGGYTTGILFKDFPLPRWWNDEYTSPEELKEKSKSGDYNILSPDEYQLDWTFEYTAPPNPLYVVSTAPPFKLVVNQYGHPCGSNDPTNPGKLFGVVQHGTFKFPYNKVGEAVAKAEPGWTVLIHAGSYPESLPAVNKPLTLKADGGTVVIGK